MKKRITVIALVFSFFQWNTSEGQVLISLLLGDKLNSDKIEFGLDGGLNWSNISNVPNSESLRGFNLGFYFDFKIKENFYFHTGVGVKSPLGAKNITPYSLNNVGLDSLFESGSVTRNLRYFHVPLQAKFMLSDKFFVELGPQLALLNKGSDEFTDTVIDNEDLTFTNEVRDNYKRIDFGLVGGVGYKIKKSNGMSIGIKYYYGLTDILKDNLDDPLMNRSLYLFARIPIGASKASE
jgi:hypothetical protein